MKSIALLAFAIASASSASAYYINFHNNCPYTVWPAVGKAPNGQPQGSPAWGARLERGQSAGIGIDDHDVVRFVLLPPTPALFDTYS